MPSSWEALAVALLAIVPGFIATTVWSRARTWKGFAGDLRTILQSLALSAAIQVLLSPLTIWWVIPVHYSLVNGNQDVRIAIWLFLAVIIIPVGLGLSIARYSDWLFRPINQVSKPEDLKWFRRAVAAIFKGTPLPCSWDWLFTVNRPDSRYILVEFNDGSRIGGVFGEGGRAFTTPESQGLFLPEEWVLDEDGNFLEPVPASAGLLIPMIADVRWVRILSSENSASDVDNQANIKEGNDVQTENPKSSTGKRTTDERHGRGAREASQTTTAEIAYS